MSKKSEGGDPIVMRLLPGQNPVDWAFEYHGTLVAPQQVSAEGCEMIAVPAEARFQSTPFTGYRLRRAMVDWTMEQGCSHALTLNVNRDVSYEKLRKMFGHFCLEVDRARFGRKNVYKTPSEERFFAIAFAEHVDTNIHLHAAARIGGWWTNASHVPIEVRLDRLWKCVTSGAGTTWHRPIHDSGWGFYITKSARAIEGQFFLSSDYHPSP